MAGPGKPGRKTKCVPEITDKILALIRGGNYRDTACAAAGIDSRVMREWLIRGAKGEEPFATFSAAMDEAEGAAEARHVLTITSASKEDWRAAAWILSRKYHKRWGDKIQVEVMETMESLLGLVEEIVGRECNNEVAARVLEEVTRRFGGETPSDSRGDEAPMH
jgi:hypothetical protein